MYIRFNPPKARAVACGEHVAMMGGSPLNHLSDLVDYFSAAGLRSSHIPNPGIAESRRRPQASYEYHYCIHE